MGTAPLLLIVLQLLLLHLPHLLAALPKNLVQNFISKHADFSVDPCYDFYAHVCPVGTNNTFFKDLVQIKKNNVKAFKERSPIHDIFVEEDTEVRMQSLNKLLQSDVKLDKLCTEDLEWFDRFVCYLTTTTWTRPLPCDEFLEMSCEAKVKAIVTRDPPSSENYMTARYSLSLAWDAYLAYKHVSSLDGKARNLYQKLKKAVGNTIKQTPWAKKKNVVNRYLKALDDIKFTTFADLANVTFSTMNFYKSVANKCEKGLAGRYAADVKTVFCDVIATGSALEFLEEPTKNVYPFDKASILRDSTQIFNSEDDRIYMGNDMMLLLNTDYPSDLFGTIGWSLTHEIMHTFVFDHMDQNRTLAPFWTKKAGCVKEQTLKTCRNFPTIPCDTKSTFEEDAADLLAYRIVWDLYQKAYTRKTKVQNYESLDKKQLFFYGAAVVFCQTEGMEQKMTSGDVHSNAYQRVNSLMSQMDEFSNAFSCKPTDRMVQNKGTHCDLYGPKAPLTRKSSNNLS